MGTPFVEDDLAPGQVLGNRYKINDVLGQGGMGMVYSALDLTNGAPVAIKLPRADIRNRRKTLARFQQEARAVAKLRGPHVVRVRDVAELDDGTPFIVMDLLAGKDLAGELETRGALPVAEAVRYVLEAASGVAEAHAAGIVHRDLKPHNLFLVDEPEGRRVKVLDFGISKLSGAEVARVTTTNARLGTPLYVSPEQLVSAKYVDARSDIWSLGVILYELLSGALPFEGSTAIAVAAAIQTLEPPPPSARLAGLPPELDRIVMKALAKKASERYQSVSELAQALAPFAAPGAYVPPSPEPARAPAYQPLPPGQTFADDSANARAPSSSPLAHSPNAPVQERLVSGGLADATPRDESPSRLLLVLAALFGVALLALVLVYR